MNISLNDFLDFVLLWIRKRTGDHVGELVVYPAMVRHCLCCQANATYAHRTNGLCLACCKEQTCALCSKEFVPSLESVGVFCPSCWARMETNWTAAFEKSPAQAEQDIRSTLIAARPKLNGCLHRN